EPRTRKKQRHVAPVRIRHLLVRRDLALVRGHVAQLFRSQLRHSVVCATAGACILRFERLASSPTKFSRGFPRDERMGRSLDGAGITSGAMDGTHGSGLLVYQSRGIGKLGSGGMEEE